MTSDFFESQYGNYADLPFWRKRDMGRFVDPFFSARLAMNRSSRRLAEAVASAPPLNVLILAVKVPARARDLERLFRSMSSDHNRVEKRVATLHEGKGKFQNINFALEELDINQFDWLLVVDDDVALPANFLDRFLYLAEQTDLKLCQPAHKFHSYQSYAITQRRWNSLVRVTHYVESGPITAFRREMFPLVLPFPELRWAWGEDLAWSEKAMSHGYRIGIIDGTPISHLRPVGDAYCGREARKEAVAFLRNHGIELSRFDALQEEAMYTSLDEPTGRLVNTSS
jgi:hypothetical protein